jgi:hypothetical protein
MLAMAKESMRFGGVPSGIDNRCIDRLGTTRDCCRKGQTHPRRVAMAKGQMKSNKEARKPKKEKAKTIAANPSTKGGGGLSYD